MWLLNKYIERIVDVIIVTMVYHCTPLTWIRKGC